MVCVPHASLKTVAMPNNARRVLQNRYGKQWIISQLKWILQHSSAQLTPYVSWRPSSADWRRTSATGSVLYFRLVGEEERKVLEFHRHMIDGCGAGDYYQRQLATRHLIKQLGDMGVL